MLNTFTKKMPWMVASLFVATTIFGHNEIAADNTCRPKPAEQKTCPPKPCPPKPCCEPVPQVQLIPAYNAPARIDVRGSWDLYAGASFIYLEAMQDNMELAASVQSSAATLFSADEKTTSSIIGHDFTYKPGFKVLAGMNFDHDTWDGYAEYTWFNSKTSSSAIAAAPGGTTSSALMPTRANSYMMSNILSDTLGFGSASQNWNLSFQSLDTALARTYYVGTKLTLRSILGARFAWIDQQDIRTFTTTTEDTTVNGRFGTAGTLTMKQNFASWGAGLVGGLNANWNIGEGFRMIGNGSFDLLYTRTQTTNGKSTWATATGTTTIFAAPQARPDFVMPHASLEFGFGWGSYFDCNNWHVDLLATYGFQTFWNANQFRNDDGYYPTAGHQPSGNLYMHGLTTSARLDF